MLIRFELENYRSIYDKISYNSRSRNKGESSEYFYLNTFEDERTSDYYVKSSVLIGKNAGGKSNFIYGLRDYIIMVIGSFKNSDQIKSIQPFKLIEKNSKPTSFLCEFVQGNNWYRYSFSVFKDKVQKEKLEIKVKSWSVVYDRTAPNFNSISFPNKYKSKFNKLLENTKEDVLFLSVLYQFNVPIALGIIDYFVENYTIITPEGLYRTESVKDTEDIISDDENTLKAAVLNFIKTSDLGISNIYAKTEKTEKNEVIDKFVEFMKQNDMGDIESPDEIISLYFDHMVYNSESECKGNYSFGREFISDGTDRMVTLAGAIFYTLNVGGVLVIDEIEHKLHHILVKKIVDIFNSIDLNTKNAQLIFTSHDLLLLEENLRRDQIWIVDKGTCNQTKIFNLLDIPGVTKKTNILKQYLLGIYRGIPDIKT